MEVFFDEFEEYVKNKYGEESYLKKLMEDTLLPLQEALEKITSGDILESLFGKVKSQSILKEPLKKLASQITNSSLNLNTAIQPKATTESGLEEKPKEIILLDIGNAALTKIHSIVGVSDRERKLLEASKDKERRGSGNNAVGFILEKLLKGGLVIAGLTALMGGLFTDGK
jgi:hypothetical protein